jgi:TonB-dependent starch-binding outer membrane protein SusC
MLTDMRCKVGGLCGALALALMTGCATSGAPASAPGESGSRADTGQATSVATLTGEDLEHQRVGRVEELFEGRVSGVQVIRQSNGHIALRIRGITSITGSNEPLIVIDGMPVQGHYAGAALMGINPRDVERIDVLKDAASTSFYGMRGANGVIVITTRRGG